MLTQKEAKQIGIHACIEKIGIEFCKKYDQNAGTTYGLHEQKMYCYVGIDNQINQLNKYPSKLILSENGFPYYASCDVDMLDGKIDYLECCVPPIE